MSSPNPLAVLRDMEVAKELHVDHSQPEDGHYSDDGEERDRDVSHDLEEELSQGFHYPQQPRHTKGLHKQEWWQHGELRERGGGGGGVRGLPGR